jgi:hypothetical protein
VRCPNNHDGTTLDARDRVDRPRRGHPPGAHLGAAGAGHDLAVRRLRDPPHGGAQPDLAAKSAAIACVNPLMPPTTR